MDNHSTDGTKNLIQKFQKRFSNLKHIIHHRNIGGNANICRAFEIAKKEYLWVLCDDDGFNWTHWDEVKKAVISDDYDMIYTVNYLSQKSEKVTPGYLAFLASFLPGAIYKTKFITDDILQNMYGVIHTWFPQCILSLHVLFNLSGKYYFPQNNLIIRGIIKNAKENVASLTRGIDKKVLHPDLKRMFWHVGFIKVAQIISDPEKRKQVIKTTNFNEKWNENFFSYCNSILDYNNFHKGNSEKNLFDVQSNLFPQEKIIFLIARYSFLYKFIKYLPIYIKYSSKGISLCLLYKLKIRIWNKKWFTRNNKKPAD